MRSLLDVNVIISLLDPDHDFHSRAHAWWEENQSEGWASQSVKTAAQIRSGDQHITDVFSCVVPRGSRARTGQTWTWNPEFLRIETLESGGCSKRLVC